MVIYPCILAWKMRWTRGAWQTTVPRVAKSQTPLSTMSMFNYKPDFVRQEWAVAGKIAPALQGEGA